MRRRRDCWRPLCSFRAAHCPRTPRTNCRPGTGAASTRRWWTRRAWWTGAGPRPRRASPTTPAAGRASPAPPSASETTRASPGAWPGTGTPTSIICSSAPSRTTSASRWPSWTAGPTSTGRSPAARRPQSGTLTPPPSRGRGTRWWGTIPTTTATRASATPFRGPSATPSPWRWSSRCPTCCPTVRRPRPPTCGN